MILGGIIFAFLFALLVAVALGHVFGRRGPGPLAGLLFFFVLLFFAIWAGGLWMAPLGPPVWGAPWLSFLLVALFLFFLFAALTPAAPRPPRRDIKTGKPIMEEADVLASVVMGVFFWLAVIMLIVAIVFGYVRPAA